MLTNKEIEALKVIRNRVMHEEGFPSLRKIMMDLNYKSPRSASLIIDQLIEKGLIQKKNDGSLLLMEMEVTNNASAQTVDIPLLGNVACGLPILAEENITAMIPVSIEIAKPNNKYFFLRAVGDSMDAVGINDGDLVLVKQQNSAENGDKVVALIDEEATIKEFQRQENAVVLKPRSTNKTHQPIILTRNFQVQGVVVMTIDRM
jgi:repressor LexA